MHSNGSANARSPIVILAGRGHINIATTAAPTGRFGIGVSRFTIDAESHSSICESGRHVVSLQLSGPVAVVSRVGGRRLEHRPGRGSIGICPAGADSSAEIRGPVDGLVFLISPECLALAGAQLKRHGGALVERMSGRDDTLFGLGRALEAEARAGHPNGLLYWTSLADALIRRLAMRYVTGTAAPRRGSLGRDALARVDDYIRAHLDASLDIDSLAAIAGCERYRFARSFRVATGVTPHRYVTRLRLDSARTLMQSKGMTLADVALTAGFYDQSHLTRWFRQVYGCPPGAMVAGKDVQDRKVFKVCG